MSAAQILLEIISRADGLELPASVKEQFKQLVRQTGAMHCVSGMARAQQVDFARRLLAARVSRPTIRDRLMATHEVSRSQAYEIIHAALNCPENAEVSGR